MVNTPDPTVCKESPKVTGWQLILCMLLIGLTIGAAILMPRWDPGQGATPWRQGTFLLTLVLVTLLFFALGIFIRGRPAGILIDDRNRMSLSRLQMTLWTVVILAGWGISAISNASLEAKAPGYLTKTNPSGKLETFGPLDVAVPPQLWMAMGIAITSLAGTPLILNIKANQKPPVLEESARFVSAMDRESQAQTRFVGLVAEHRCPEDAVWSDLFTGDEAGNVTAVDLGKVQMFYFTLILIVSYTIAVFTLVGRHGAISQLPVLSDGAIALLGLSHAGYLGAKAAPNTKPTPSI